MAQNAKKLWAILLVVVMLTGMLPQISVNAAEVTELRMDLREAGNVKTWTEVVFKPGITIIGENINWAANTSIENSVGEATTIYTSKAERSVRIAPNKSGDTLKAGWYDVSYWNPSTAGTRNWNATVFANNKVQLDNVEQELGAASSWSKAGSFYFTGAEDEYFQLTSSSSGSGLARVGDVKFTWSENQSGDVPAATEKVTELRMDLRVNSGKVTPWSNVTAAPGVTFTHTEKGWSANTGLTNSIGEEKTVYVSYEGSSVKIEPNASGSVLKTGWYDVSFWNPSTPGTRNFNATVFANGALQLDNIEQELGEKETWSNVGRFYFSGEEGEYLQLTAASAGSGMARLGDVKFVWSEDQSGELPSPLPSVEPSPSESSPPTERLPLQPLEGDSGALYYKGYLSDGKMGSFDAAEFKKSTNGWYINTSADIKLAANNSFSGSAAHGVNTTVPYDGVYLAPRRGYVGGGDYTGTMVITFDVPTADRYNIDWGAMHPTTAFVTVSLDGSTEKAVGFSGSGNGIERWDTFYSSVNLTEGTHTLTLNFTTSSSTSFIRFDTLRLVPSALLPSPAPSQTPFSWNEDFSGKTVEQSEFVLNGNLIGSIEERASGNNALRLELPAGAARTEVFTPSMKEKYNGADVSSDNLVISAKFNIEKQEINSSAYQSIWYIKTADEQVIAQFDMMMTGTYTVGVGYHYNDGPITRVVGPTESKIELAKGEWYQLLMSLNCDTCTYDAYFLDNDGNVIFKTDGTPAVLENISVRDVMIGGRASVDTLSIENFLAGSIIWLDDFCVKEDPNYVFPDLDNLTTPSPRPTFPPKDAVVFSIMQGDEIFSYSNPSNAKNFQYGSVDAGGSLHAYCDSPLVKGVFNLKDVPTGLYEVYFKVPYVHSTSTDKLTLDLIDSLGKTVSETYNTKAIADNADYFDNVSPDGLKSQSWIKLPGEFTFYQTIPGTLSAGKMAGSSGMARYDEVALVKVDEVTALPMALNVNISGSNKPGATLTGKYEYIDDNGDQEQNSAYKWYTKSSGSAAWVLAAQGTATAASYPTYTLKVGDKFVKFEIEAKNSAGKTGPIKSTEWELLYEEDLRPTASQVQINGDVTYSGKLTGTYEYNDVNLDPEGDSEYKWLLSNDQYADPAEWTVLERGECKADTPVIFTIPQGIEGYIRFAITPKNDSSQANRGNTVYSNAVGPLSRSNVKPEAKNLTFAGQVVQAEGIAGLAIGGKAEAEYIYTNSLGSPEGESVITWYRSDSAVGPWTQVTTGQSYTPGEADKGKFLRFGVTPVSSDRSLGDEVFSDAYIVKWKLTFVDEFDYEAVNAKDPQVTAKWTSDTKQRVLGHPAAAVQARIPENTSVSDGVLKITTRKEHLDQYNYAHDWTTGNVYTSQRYGPYGYYEARVKYAKATGLNQSFWWMTSQTGVANGGVEMDFMEGHYPYHIASNLHRYETVTNPETGHTEDQRRTMSAQHYPFGNPGTETLADNFNIIGGYLKPNNPSYAWDAEENSDTYRVFFNNEIMRSTRSVQYVPAAGRIYMTVAVFPGFGGYVVESQADGCVLEFDYCRYYEEIGVSQTDGSVSYEVMNNELQSALAQANQLLGEAVIGNSEGNYTSEAKTALQSAVNAAQEVTDPAKKQAAANTLNSAIDAFLASQIGDSAALKAALTAAQKILQEIPAGDGYGQCPDRYMNNLRLRIDRSNLILNSKPSQKSIDSELLSLQRAMNDVLSNQNTSGSLTQNGMVVDIHKLLADGVTYFSVEDVTKATLRVPANLEANLTMTLKNSNNQAELTLQAGSATPGDYAYGWSKPSLNGKAVYGAFSFGGLQTDSLSRLKINLPDGYSAGVLSGTNVQTIDASIGTDSFEAAAEAGSYPVKYTGSGYVVIYTNQLTSYVIYKDEENNNPDNDPNGGNNGGDPSTNIPGGGTIVIPPTITSTPEFKDIAGHWAEQEIKAMAKKGVINGRNKTQFAPDESVTRAEFAAMIRRALNLNTSLYQGSIPDISNDDWFANEVQAVLNEGIMSGDANGYFRPNDQISRQEMAKVVVNAHRFLYGEADLSAELSFTDSGEIADWAKPFVNEAAGLGLVRGMDDGSFAPYANSTRAQAAAVLARLLR